MIILIVYFVGTIMIIVIVFSRKFHINPDNVATPIAASLGDLTTLVLLSLIASLLFHTLGKVLLTLRLLITTMVVFTQFYYY